MCEIAGIPCRGTGGMKGLSKQRTVNMLCVMLCCVVWCYVLRRGGGLSNCPYCTDRSDQGYMRVCAIIIWWAYTHLPLIIVLLQRYAPCHRTSSDKEVKASRSELADSRRPCGYSKAKEYYLHNCSRGNGERNRLPPPPN